MPGGLEEVGSVNGVLDLAGADSQELILCTAFQLGQELQEPIAHAESVHTMDTGKPSRQVSPSLAPQTSMYPVGLLPGLEFLTVYCVPVTLSVIIKKDVLNSSMTSM